MFAHCCAIARKPTVLIFPHPPTETSPNTSILFVRIRTSTSTRPRRIYTPDIDHVCSLPDSFFYRPNVFRHTNTPITRSNRSARTSCILTLPSQRLRFVVRCAMAHTSTASDKILLGLSNLCSISLPSTSTKPKSTFTPTIHHACVSRSLLQLCNSFNTPTLHSLDRTGPRAYHVPPPPLVSIHCAINVTH